MFGFIKKLKTVYEVPEPLGIRERAIKVFSRIEGLDDIKEMMLRALESPERAHTLLIGAPACAKSLFMLEIEKFMRSKDGKKVVGKLRKIKRLQNKEDKLKHHCEMLSKQAAKYKEIIPLAQIIWDMHIGKNELISSETGDVSGYSVNPHLW